MIHEHVCCNRGSAALGREASSMRETSFVKRISFRSRALHVSHLLPALHASRDTPFDGLRASRACRGTLHSLLRFTRNTFSWRCRPSTVLGTLSFVEGRRTVMNFAGWSHYGGASLTMKDVSASLAEPHAGYSARCRVPQRRHRVGHGTTHRNATGRANEEGTDHGTRSESRAPVIFQLTSISLRIPPERRYTFP